MIYYNLSVSGSSGELSESRKKKIAQTGSRKKKRLVISKGPVGQLMCSTGATPYRTYVPVPYCATPPLSIPVRYGIR